MNQISPIAIILLLFTSLQMIGQASIIIENDFLLFEDGITKEPVLVYNDSTLATGFNFIKTGIKTSFPKTLKKGDFNTYQFNINEETYLVDAGCGPVIHYQDEEFTRIDKSFRHKNQFKAIPFQKNNEIYLWGGYGLFNYKNILTKYNFRTQEWNDVSQNIENGAPPVQSTKTYIKTKDKIYVFGGKSQDINNTVKSKHLKEDVWELDLKTNTWTETGKHNVENFIDLKNNDRTFTFNRKNKTIILKDEILEIDITNDRIELFHQRNFKSLVAIVYHKTTDEISYVFEKSNRKLMGVTESYADFKGDFMRGGLFYKPKKIRNEFWGLLMLGILILGWIIYKNQTKREKLYAFKNKIIYRTATNEFSYNTHILKNLNKSKKEIIKILLENKEQFVPLNDLNRAITEDPKNESYGAIKKRREMLLKELQQEFSLLLAINRETVFETRKNDADRRIKEIRLNIKITIL